MRVLALMGLVACGTSGGQLEVPQDTGPDEVYIDRYDPDHLMRVDITVDEDDWYNLTHEQPNTFYELLLGPDCFDGPRASDYTWFPSEVTVDDETLADVGIRKKALLVQCHGHGPP